MAFDRILKKLADRTGAKGAMMFDYDGELVASHAVESLDMGLIGAHHGVVLNIVKDASSCQNDLQGVKTVVITTDEHKLALRTLKEGYCLLVLMGNSGFLGKALFESEQTVKELEEEMG